MRSSWILAGGCGSPLSFQAARIRGLPNESAYSDREMRGRARLRFFRIGIFSDSASVCRFVPERWSRMLYVYGRAWSGSGLRCQHPTIKTAAGWQSRTCPFQDNLPLCRASSRRVAANSCGAMSRRGSPCTQRSLSRSRSTSCVSRTRQQRLEGWSVSHCAGVSTSRLKMFHECDNFSVV